MPSSRSFRRPSTVLAVDDHPLLLRTIQAVLERDGHRLLTASTGQVALDVCRHDAIDVIVLDVMMPGMTGIEVADRLRGNPLTFTIPILFCTASGDLVPSRLTADESIDVIAKPFEVTALRQAVRRLMAGGNPARLAFG